MCTDGSRIAFRFVLAALLLPGLIAEPLHAAAGETDEGPPSASAPRPRRDFYFAPPMGTIGLRGAWVFARTGSDLFEFVEDQLTVEKQDFSGPAVAFDVGLALKPRLDVVVGVQISGTSTRSEYRDYVDNSRLPIEQTTKLKIVDVSGSIRYALRPRAYEVSRLAWVPRHVVPYVGGGLGGLWYEFDQTGDFVDFVDLSVFSGAFHSEGWTPSVHAFGGVDVRVHRRIFVSIEGRYLWADARLDEDFVDFEPIDLAGFRLATGINFVF